MKTGLHPKYNDTITITCACGHSILAGSTIDSIKTELCSECHPFYTGKQKLVDTAGKVDKFMAKVKKAQAFKEQNVKVVEEDEKEEEKKEEVTEVKEEKVKKPILDFPTGKDDVEEEVVEEKAEETKEEATEVAEEKTEKKPAAKKAPAKKASKK